MSFRLFLRCSLLALIAASTACDEALVDTSHSGLDVDRDVVLDDAEIHIAATCDPPTCREGNLDIDATNAANFATLRVVTGTLSIRGKGAVKLPALETVGSLQVSGRLVDVRLPALTSVADDVFIATDTPALVELDRLASVGKDFSVVRAQIQHLSAPALARIGGNLRLESSEIQRISLGVTSVGGNVDVSGLDGPEELRLDLVQVGGNIQVETSDITALTMAPLREARGAITVAHNRLLQRILLGSPGASKNVVIENNTSLREIDMHDLVEINHLHIRNNDQLRRVDLRSLQTVLQYLEISGSDQLAELDVHALAIILGGATFDALGTLTSFESELSFVDGELVMTRLGKVRTIVLPALNTAKALVFHDGPALQSIELPSMGRTRRLTFSKLPALIEGASIIPITEVDELLTIDRVPASTGLGIVQNVRRARKLSLDSVTGLRDLRGLPKLTFDSLDIRRCQDLVSLAGAEELHRLEGDLQLIELDNLVGLQGLSGLTEVKGTVQVLGLDQLTDLQGLQQLKTIGGDLQVRANAALRSLTGLEALKRVGGSLRIQANSNLPTEEIEALFQRLGH